ncbi:origin recognition complex subunit 3 N-terminus-domain-containing protein [Mycena albidolilacea]|uniref:Origin recognition complex subunit 3 N-terminus-domain-containing protein n=1 Tax=Mycena albidolilacea TaxID=1033008 RepID=A0AAD7ERX0_9AGAR|nr:origin recognition complex subunit 3 N-terminus-domain-containing protein [Mycena albidolilacea]
MTLHLEDIQQTVIYIPYEGDDSDVTDEPSLPLTHTNNDLNDGPQLRFAAYKAAWTQCLDRVKSIIAELYNPVVSEVVDRLENIYADVLPGLPFPELPVITIADLPGGSIFLEHLTDRLDEDVTIVNHLYPSDCLNLTSAMKNLIGSFLERDSDAPKRKPAASLAPYDLNLLQAWYDAAEDRPGLVVILHEFEQFDASIVQDMFYICSLQVARLPLTFILSLSAPSPASYLHASFSRSTLAVLRVYHFAVPSGREVLHDVILKTFFDPIFDLPLLPGPTLLEYLEDYYTTHNPSLDALITLLQVAHLKHYSTDVFTFLSSATPPISSSPTARELAFLQALLSRLHAKTPTNSAEEWRAHARSPDILLQAVDAEREAFSRRTRMTKLGVTLLHLVLTHLRGSAIDKGLNRWRGAVGMRRVLDAEEDGVAGLAELLRKLPSTDRDALFERLETYLNDLPGDLRPTDSDVDVTDWLETFLGDFLQPPETATPLWSVWYTGFTPFPSEIVNPALRPSIISGLSFPHSYTGQDSAPEDEDTLEDLPDTSILFKGYVKAGKMINIYDWFDNFRMVLEGQRSRAAKGTANAKGKGKGKGKVKQVEEEDDDDEKWKLGVQARFMRGLHELDYLGFIKHTSRGGGGRKGESVLRTVLGVLE